MTNETQKLIDDLNLCRVLCPTFGPAWCELGQIEKFILNQPQRAEHIRKGFALAPSDPTAGFVAARLAASEGDWPIAVARFRHSLEVSPGMRNEVLDLIVREFNRPAEALQIAAGNIAALRTLIELLENRPGDRGIADEARREQSQLLRIAAQKSDCDAQTLVLAARSYAGDGELEDAIKCFRRALAIEYGQTGWHFELAKLLSQANHHAEAAREARVCLIQSPHYTEAEELLRRIDAKNGGK